jgi:polyribonucleotide nucleotidyltransferase
MISFKIDKEFIGAVIGPGGKVIQEIQKETEQPLCWKRLRNSGVVSIYAPDDEKLFLLLRVG